MNTTIKTTGIRLTSALDQYTRYKLAKLVKFIEKTGGEPLVEVELGRTTDHHKHGAVYRAEFNLQIPGRSLMRSEATSYDLYTAIVIARDDLLRQIKVTHTKQQTLIRRGARRLKDSLRFWR